MPDPPHLKKRRKLTWKENWCIFKEASRLHAASWVWDIGPDLRPNDYKKDTDDYERNLEDDKKEPSIVDDPALQQVYMMRPSTYRDALQNFFIGNQEGIQQVVEERGVLRLNSKRMLGVLRLKNRRVKVNQDEFFWKRSMIHKEWERLLLNYKEGSLIVRLLLTYRTLRPRTWKNTE